MQFRRLLTATRNLLDRSLDCGALEAKFQQWAAGKKAGIRIEVDFRKYKKDGLGKPMSLKGVDMYVDSGKRKIDFVYIIDTLKPVAAHVKPRVFKRFLGIYVEIIHRPQPDYDWYPRGLRRPLFRWRRPVHSGWNSIQN